MSTIAAIPMLPRTARDAAPLATGGDLPSEVLDLYTAHGAALFRFCRFTLGADDDAEDVLQDTFLKLLQHLARGGPRTNLRAWLFEVAANGCRDRLRLSRRFIAWLPSLDRRTAPATDDRRDYRGAAVALASLGARERLLLALRAQGLSYREIAAASGVREQSVGRLLARAIGRWKRAVAISREP